MIQTINLTKRYGELMALANLNLQIEKGDCFGFIGPNGAGKTTTIKILATLLRPTWGQALIDGMSVGFKTARDVRAIIGYVPDYFGSYEDMVVKEYLEFFAASYNIHGAKRKQVIDDVLALTDMGYKADAEVNTLSRGMQQRLSLARVLLHDPKVLLLDEPAGNLDPRARIEMRELLKELRRMGKTILISSHILPELQDLCNTVGIIERGELLYSGPWTDIVKRARTGLILHVGVAHNQELAAAMLSQDPNVVNVAANNGHLEVSLKDGVSDYTFIPQRLVQGGFKLTLLKEEEVNLETAFMRLTKGMVQ